MNWMWRRVLPILIATPLIVSACSKSDTPTKPPPTVTGGIEVRSVPEGAAILLDGSSTSTSTPDTLPDVPVGSHVVGLKLTGYADTSAVAVVTASTVASVSVTLRYVPTYTPPPISFDSRTTSAPGTLGWIATSDFDSDGRLDLVVSSSQAPNRRVLLLAGNGDGSFTARGAVADTTADLWGVTAGDFDGDGKPDVACLVSSGIANILLFLGNGDGTFRRGAVVRFPYSPLAVSVGPLRAGELDGDGADDLLIGFRAGSNSLGLGVWRSMGAGGLQAMVEYSRTFPSYTISSPTSIALADFTGDGIVDVAQGLYGLQELPGGVVLWKGAGGGSLQPSPAFVGAQGFCQDVGIGDLNGDGKADLVTANTGGAQAQGTAAVLLGRGDGTFRSPIHYRTGMYSVGVAVGDFNGDVRADLAILDNFSSTLSALAGYGDGVFQAAVPFPTTGGGFRVVMGDFDGDSRPDLAVTFSQGAAGSTVEVMLAR